MICSLFLRDERRVEPGRAHQAVERGFEWLVHHYTRGLDFVLRHQRPTLFVFLATVALSALLYVFEPKGFFPQQDTGIIAGVSDASQDVSFAEMLRLQHELMDVVAKDPDVASYATGLGGSRPGNNGFVIIGLKPREQRKSTADQVIARL